LGAGRGVTATGRLARQLDALLDVLGDVDDDGGRRRGRADLRVISACGIGHLRIGRQRRARCAFGRREHRDDQLVTESEVLQGQDVVGREVEDGSIHLDQRDQNLVADVVRPELDEVLDGRRLGGLGGADGERADEKQDGESEEARHEVASCNEGAGVPQATGARSGPRHVAL
jgi:hypothetical protein